MRHAQLQHHLDWSYTHDAGYEIDDTVYASHQNHHDNDRYGLLDVTQAKRPSKKIF